MEVAVVGLAGAGFALWASGIEPRLSPAAARNGVAFIRAISRQGCSATVERLSAEVAKDVLDELSRSRRDAVSVHRHLAALPRLIADHGVASASQRQALATAIDLSERGGGSDEIASHVASEILLSARRNGDLAAGDLDETLCFSILRRLLTATLDRSERLLKLLPAMVIASTDPDCGFHAGKSVSVANSTDSIDAHLSVLAAAYAVPPPMLAAALAAMPRASFGSRMPVAGEERAMECADVLRELTAAQAVLAKVQSRTLLMQVRSSLEGGQFAAADLALAEGEAQADDEISKEDETGTDIAFSSDAPIWCQLRGRLAALNSDWRGAARHYADAAVRAARISRLSRGPHLIQQARALVNCGLDENDDAVLTDAARVYAEAGGYFSEAQAPLEWGGIQLELGELMLKLAERQQRPEQLLAAALHFKPALDVFLGQNALDDWARAQLGLARALQRSGARQGDVVLLGDAAFAFRAALGIMTVDRTPEGWTAAQLGLGETLVRIAEETGKIDVLGDAIPALKTVLLALDRQRHLGIERSSAEAALGRAYAMLATETREDYVLRNAISLLESALISGSRSLAPSERAAIEQVRGTALWSLGEAQSNLRLLEDALRAKLAALEHYEAVGDFSAVVRIREELDSLNSAISHLTSAARIARGKRV